MNAKRRAGPAPAGPPAKRAPRPDAQAAVVHLGALKYLPHAIYKLLETIPPPWAADAPLRLLAHKDGALTFVDGVRRVDSARYAAAWCLAAAQMRAEQRDRVEFRRARVPAFDDEEPVHDYRALVRLVPRAPEPLALRECRTPYEQLAACQELLPPNSEDEPPFMDPPSLATAKALPAPLPFGPKFCPPSADAGLPPSNVDDPAQLIVRPRQQQRRAECRVAFPHLYGGDAELPADTLCPPLNPAVRATVHRKDGKVPFFVDRTINAATDPASKESDARGDVDPPFLAGLSLPAAQVAESLALYDAPYPFNQPQPVLKRPQDVALFKRLYTHRLPPRSAGSYTRSGYRRLLKSEVRRQLRASKGENGSHSRNTSLLRSLAQTPFFSAQKGTWLDAGLQLCKQGHRALLLLMHKRGLHFLHLDYNFNLKPTRTLSTKERKRSRFGHSFHLVRELLRVAKLVVDLHVSHRLGNIDSFQLADGIAYVFSNMGQLTGLYRYKYKVMHQITECTDLKNIICDRLHMDELGCGVWQPMWRVWLSLVRGLIPTLERWLGNLLTRQFYGRVSKGVRHTVTKQRIESQYDLELRAAAMHDILDAMPMELRKSKPQIVMQHLSEAWRCWKANVEYDMSMLPLPARLIVERYIRARSENWMRAAAATREKILRLANVDSAVARKNLARQTRLYMRNEHDRQARYKSEGPSLAVDEAVAIYKTMASYLSSRSLPKMDFPDDAFVHNNSLLVLAVEKLRNDVGGAQGSRLTKAQQDDLAMLDSAIDSPHDKLSEIRQALLNKRVFPSIGIALRDDHLRLEPTYEIPMADRLVDMFLAQYLWFRAEETGLFPSFVKPQNKEVMPVVLHTFCGTLNEDATVWAQDGKTVLLHADVAELPRSVDITLLNKLLRLIVHQALADYMTSRLNATLVYKDMTYANNCGIFNGLAFAPFLIQYYLMAVDVLLMGLPRSLTLDVYDHPIRTYVRNDTDVYVVLHLSVPECDELVDDLRSKCQGVSVNVQKTCWPLDLAPRLVRSNEILCRCACVEFGSRVPSSLGSIKWVEASCLSPENPALHFQFAGFEVRLSKGIERHVGESTWLLTDTKSGKRTGSALIRIAEPYVDQFAAFVRQTLMSSGSTSFSKIAGRWNRIVSSFATYFREAVSATPKALETLARCEAQVQTKIKMALNSKMPTRFPPCVFYASTELGGLDMLSASKVVVPAEDSYEESILPNILRYVRPWESEIADSEIAWREFNELKVEAQQSGLKLEYEDVEHLVDRGLPRVGTLFMKDRNLVTLDCGLRHLHKTSARRDLFYWTDRKHDGKLHDFSEYREDVLKSLGGVNVVLSHTLFAATGFESYESLFWQKQSTLEQQLASQKLTNAQRSGLSQIPNRRFTLWWSPTINRANVYIGFLVQLDLTGIFLHGKIPTLKVSYVQLFRAHLWQKIHESVVLDLCHVLDRESAVLHVDAVQKLLVHPRKSYRMNASAADILLTSAGTEWPLSAPSLITEADDYKSNLSTSQSQFWIDVQLKYGDFDSHDTARYAKGKFLDYTNDGVSLYPSRTGLIVCIDLAYNTFSAYGYWFPGLKTLLQSAMRKIMQSNAALYVLRERIRRALQLHSGKPSEGLTVQAHDFAALCEQNCMIVDTSSVYRVRTYRTKNGNTANRAEDGALVTFSPLRGTAIVLPIPSSTWAGQKRLSTVSKWKSAELTADILRGLDPRPESVVISSAGLKDPFEVNMLEFQDVGVSITEMNLPLSSVLSIKEFTNTPQPSEHPAAASSSTSVNLYDDWLLTQQPQTAFARLMLLLKGIELDAAGTMRTLAHYGRADGYIWPKLSPDVWIEVEEMVTDLVVTSYARTHGIRKESITSSAVRDIVLGKSLDNEEFGPASVISNIDQKDDTNQPIVAQTVESHNVHGERITVVTSSQYEQQTFNSQSRWQARALVCSSRRHQTAHTFKTSPDMSALPSQKNSKFVWPKNLLDQLVAASDVRNTVMAIAYGKDAADGEVEVTSLALVPQLGSQTQVSWCSPVNMPHDVDVIGYCRVCPGPLDESIPPLDLSLLSALSGASNPVKGKCVCCLLSPSDGFVEVRAYLPTDEGLSFGRSNKDLLSPSPANYSKSFASLCETEVAPNATGCFWVPDDEIWNYAFLATRWNSQIPAVMKLGYPLNYYDPRHRPSHFISFQNLESGEQNPIDMEDEAS